MLSPTEWWKQRAHRRQIERSLPDILWQMATAMRSGATFNQVLNQVTLKGKGVMADEMARVNREIQAGRPQEEALNGMVQRMGNRDLELAVLAINVNASRGGNLAEALVSIAERVRDRIRLRDEIRTLTSQARASALVLTLIPPFLLIVLSFLAPGYLHPMLTTSLGLQLTLVLGTLALGLLVVGNFIMYRMGVIKV